jgi:hypothetical protein
LLKFLGALFLLFCFFILFYVCGYILLFTGILQFFQTPFFDYKSTLGLIKILSAGLLGYFTIKYGIINFGVLWLFM